MLDKEMYNVLLEAMALGDAGKAIENQEKRGQTSFVASEMLPIRCPRVEPIPARLDKTAYRPFDVVRTR